MPKPILCLDFDGVIHSYASGWQGADKIPDAPVPGAMEFIRAAQEHFMVCIFSSRTNEPGGQRAMIAYMDDHLTHWFGPDAALRVLTDIQWPVEKPAAFVTLDDRAITFTGRWPTMRSLLDFKPWYK